MTVEQYRLYDFIDGIREWRGTLNLCRKINVIKGKYFIYLESYRDRFDGVVIAKHNMNLQNDICIIVELTNGMGNTNNCTYGYGLLAFNIDRNIYLTTNVKPDDVGGSLFIIVP